MLSHERTFFVTSSIAQKRRLLQSIRAAELFIDTLYDYRAKGNYRLHEFVVMPDHFHLLLTVTELSIERAVQLIKGGFAFRTGKQLGFRAPVWQKGFSETRILNARSYMEVRAYIRDNPVIRHLAATQEDYAYSSANPKFELDPQPQRLKPAFLVAPCGTAEVLA